LTSRNEFQLFNAWTWPVVSLEKISQKGLPGSGGVHSYEPSVLTHPWPVGHAHEFQHSSISATGKQIRSINRYKKYYNYRIRSITREILICCPITTTGISAILSQTNFVPLCQYIAVTTSVTSASSSKILSLPSQFSN
jgi:hypothetical protein